MRTCDDLDTLIGKIKWRFLIVGEQCRSVFCENL